MRLLGELITGAMQLAGSDTVSCGARLWQSEGGRACPLGWEDCSQPVYVDLKTGAYDYGEPDGPGHADCVRHCEHGMQSCPEDEDDRPLHEVLTNDDWRETPNAEMKRLRNAQTPNSVTERSEEWN